MTVCVFLGPTLPVEEAAAILPARYLPPARRGDLETAVLSHRPRLVAVIDGVFERAPSLWHKEILWALAQGVDVWGAASMGALRAAELEQFGMRGFGAIFEAYRSGSLGGVEGRFEDDDEVAVVHGPPGLEHLATVAMVDVRATLDAAGRAGVIDGEGERALAAVAKGIYFKARTWPALLSAARGAGLQACSLDALESWLPRGAVSRKREDALGLLRHLASRPPPPPPPRFRFERTLLWEIARVGDDA